MRHLCVVSLLVVLLISLPLSAEGSDEESPLRPVTVVLDWSINTNHTGLYAAQELGYFRQEGLDVTIEFPPETGAAGLVLSGRAQFAVSYQEEVTYARAAGTPLKAVATIIQHNTSGFGSRKEEGITRPADFQGKVYGGWGSPVEEAMIKALVEADGGDFDRIEIVPIGAMDFFAATASNIDFVWIFRGWDGIAAEKKGIELNYIPLNTRPALDYYTPVLITRDRLTEEEPDLIRSFLAAASRGYQYAVKNPAGAADILNRVAPELDAELVKASQEYLAGEYVADAARWGEMKLPVWERYGAWLEENGLLDGDFIAQEAFTNEFLPR